MKFVSIGDCCIDVYPDKRVLGGTAYNAAVIAKKYGADASLISAIGNDENGHMYQEALQEKHIHNSHLQIFEGFTSTVEITLDDHNSPIFGAWNLGALEKWELTTPDLDFINSHDIAKCICLRPIEKNFKAFCSAPMPKTVKVGDFNGSSKYSSFTPEEIANYAHGLDIIVKSIDAKDREAIHAFQTLADLKNKIVLLTLGSKGSICFAHNQTYTQDALDLEVTNTTGFGDAYIAVFVITYSKTKNIQQAMSDATRAIGQLVQR